MSTLANDIIDSMLVLIDAEMEKHATQILSAVVSDVGTGNKCKVKIGGEEYTIVWYGTSPSVDKVVRVFVPNGNMSSAFTIIPGSGGGGGGSITGVTAQSPITGGGTSGNVAIGHQDSGVTAGTYTQVTTDAKGHITAGANPTTLAGYGISDANISGTTITLGSNTANAVPACTTSDNGKFLTVVAGVAQWTTVPNTNGQSF